MNRPITILLLLVAVVIWGWTFVVVKDAVASFGIIPFLALRFALGAACLTPFALRSVSRADLKPSLWIGLALGFAFLFQTIGLAHGTATNAGIITGLFVVFAPLANRFLFGVRTGWMNWVGIGVSLIGLAMLTGLGAVPALATDAITLLGAVLFGVHIALLDRYAKTHASLALAWGQTSIAALLFLLASPFFEAWSWPSPSVWAALAITGILATAGGFYVQTVAQRHLPAVQAAMIILAEPLFAALFGYLLHDDLLTAAQWAGAGVLIGAVVAVELLPLLRKPTSS